MLLPSPCRPFRTILHRYVLKQRSSPSYSQQLVIAFKSLSATAVRQHDNHVPWLTGLKQFHTLNRQMGAVSYSGIPNSAIMKNER